MCCVFLHHVLRQFNQTVRIRSIAIQASNVAQAPRKIKLLINRPTIGFDDFSEGEATQEFELSEEQVREGKRIPLRFVRFQAVNALHVRSHCPPVPSVR